MAFSYSDKNFTVIGNLCFVHIPLDGTETFFDIPPAISDRMLFNRITCTYTYYTAKSSRGHGNSTPNTGFASISYGEIVCSKPSDGFLYGYLFCYFPIDSNK